MDADELYEIVYTATADAMRDTTGGEHIRLSRRMVGGTVKFIDSEGRVIKETESQQFFRKVTSVRDKLRVLEQKINNNGGLSSKDKAELQAYISRSYGSLTTFNFLFQEDRDRFKGTGG